MKRSRSAFERFQPQQLPHGHASVVARIPFYLDQLRLSATHVEGPHWHALHVVPNVALFELEHGLEQLRFAHNHRGMLEAARRRIPVVGHHGGFSDLFVPIVTPAGYRPDAYRRPFS